MASNYLMQGTQEWLDYRKNHIGSSDIACIMDHNPYKSSNALWKEKTSQVNLDNWNDAIAHGKEYEPIARELYIEKTGVFVLPAVHTSERWEVAMGSYDGISLDGKIGLEIKCPKNEKLYNDAVNGIIPDMYYDQIQWQFFCKPSLERIDYMVYMDSSKFQIISCFPDVNYHEDMLSEAKEFWKYVKKGSAEIDDEKDNDLINEIKILRNTKKGIEETLEELEKKIKEKYSDHLEYKFIKNGASLLWHKRKGVTDWKSIQVKYNISDKEIEKHRKKSTKYCTFEFSSNI